MCVRDNMQLDASAGIHMFKWMCILKLHKRYNKCNDDNLVNTLQLSLYMCVGLQHSKEDDNYGQWKYINIYEYI